MGFFGLKIKLLLLLLSGSGDGGSDNAMMMIMMMMTMMIMMMMMTESTIKISSCHWCNSIRKALAVMAIGQYSPYTHVDSMDTSKLNEIKLCV